MDDTIQPILKHNIDQTLQQIDSFHQFLKIYHDVEKNYEIQ